MKIIKVAFGYYEEIKVADNASDAEIDKMLDVMRETKGADIYGWSDDTDDEFIVC